MTFGVSSFAQSAFATTDFAVGQILWYPIDDDAVANWTDILQPTTSETVITFGASYFGDGPFAGAFTISVDPLQVTWTAINDSQTANWAEVVQ